MRSHAWHGDPRSTHDFRKSVGSECAAGGQRASREWQAVPARHKRVLARSRRGDWMRAGTVAVLDPNNHATGALTGCSLAARLLLADWARDKTPPRSTPRTRSRATSSVRSGSSGTVAVREAGEGGAPPAEVPCDHMKGRACGGEMRAVSILKGRGVWTVEP